MQPKFITLFLISILLTAGFWTPASAAPAPVPAASGGSEAWTGVITYTKTQTQTANKTIDRVSGRGKDTRNWEMHLDYKATVGISEAPGGKGETVAKATITHTMTNKETNVAVEKNSCDRGKTWQDMTGTFTSESKISGQGTEDANVNLGLNDDGTYSIGVGVPEISGTITGSDSSTFSGQCTPKEGKTHNLPPTPTKIQGASLTSDGKTRVDPREANKLAGSYSLPLPGGVVETITWNLQRHVTPLRIIDVKFEDMKYPKWNDWHEITEQVGTADGNWVKIKVTVFNGSSVRKEGDIQLKETYQGDKWDGAKPDSEVRGGSFVATLEPGEQREVEVLWNSSGYAWYDDGRPRLVQRFKAELWSDGKKVEEKIQNLKVTPRPLVLVPGIWTEPNAFEIYQNILTTSHSYDWKACTMVNTWSSGQIGGEGTVMQTPPKGGSVYTTADNLNTYVNGIRRDRNAWHVDMLGHGTGGLVARLYVHKQMETLPDNLPVVRNLLLLGTPNNGVNCAEILAALFASEDTKQAARELAPEEMAEFNKYVTLHKGTKFAALVGNVAPIPCGYPGWSDGRVTEESAKFGMIDIMTVKSLHGDLLNTENFSKFIKPHIATGPKATYMPQIPGLPSIGK